MPNAVVTTRFMGQLSALNASMMKSATGGITKGLTGTAVVACSESVAGSKRKSGEISAQNVDEAGVGTRAGKRSGGGGGCEAELPPRSRPHHHQQQQQVLVAAPLTSPLPPTVALATAVPSLTAAYASSSSSSFSAAGMLSSARATAMTNKGGGVAVSKILTSAPHYKPPLLGGSISANINANMNMRAPPVALLSSALLATQMLPHTAATAGAGSDSGSGSSNRDATVGGLSLPVDYAPPTALSVYHPLSLLPSRKQLQRLLDSTEPCDMHINCDYDFWLWVESQSIFAPFSYKTHDLSAVALQGKVITPLAQFPCALSVLYISCLLLVTL